MFVRSRGSRTNWRFNHSLSMARMTGEENGSGCFAVGPVDSLAEYWQTSENTLSPTETKQQHQCSGTHVAEKKISCCATPQLNCIKF